MIKPNIKYRVTLTAEERGFLQQLIRKGKTSGYRIRHAQLLLALDELPANEQWTDEKLGYKDRRGGGGENNSDDL